MAVTPEQLTAARDAAINCLEIGARGSNEIGSWIEKEFFSDGAWVHEVFSSVAQRGTKRNTKDTLPEVINADGTLKIGMGVSQERFTEFETLMNQRAVMAREAQEALEAVLTGEVATTLERLNADHLGVKLRGTNYMLYHIAVWWCVDHLAILPKTMNSVLFNPLDKTTLYFDECYKIMKEIYIDGTSFETGIRSEYTRAMLKIDGLKGDAVEALTQKSAEYVSAYLRQDDGNAADEPVKEETPQLTTRDPSKLSATWYETADGALNLCIGRRVVKFGKHGDRVTDQMSLMSTLIVSWPKRLHVEDIVKAIYKIELREDPDGLMKRLGALVSRVRGELLKAGLPEDIVPSVTRSRSPGTSTTHLLLNVGHIHNSERSPSVKATGGEVGSGLADKQGAMGPWGEDQEYPGLWEEAGED